MSRGVTQLIQSDGALSKLYFIIVLPLLSSQSMKGVTPHEKRISCEVNNCKVKAKFALYQFMENFTKKWVNVCDYHDKYIVLSNAKLRKQYPGGVWVDETKN